MIKLTYRELAERLGVTPDAARMKAKRRAAAGKWRLIPGNHPQDTVYVELPEGDLPDQPPTPPAEPPERPKPPAQPENSSPATEAAIQLASGLQDRVNTLTDQLIEVMAARTADAAELATAKAGLAVATERQQELQAQIDAAAARELELQEQLDAAMVEAIRIKKEADEANRPFRRLRRNRGGGAGRARGRDSI